MTFKLILGRPGSGKSLFTFGQACERAESYVRDQVDRRVVFINYDLSPSGKRYLVGHCNCSSLSVDQFWDVFDDITTTPGLDFIIDEITQLFLTATDEQSKAFAAWTSQHRKRNQTIDAISQGTSSLPKLVPDHATAWVWYVKSMYGTHRVYEGAGKPPSNPGKNTGFGRSLFGAQGRYIRRYGRLYISAVGYEATNKVSFTSLAIPLASFFLIIVWIAWGAISLFSDRKDQSVIEELAAESQDLDVRDAVSDATTVLTAAERVAPPVQVQDTTQLQGQQPVQIDGCADYVIILGGRYTVAGIKKRVSEMPHSPPAIALQTQGTFAMMEAYIKYARHRCEEFRFFTTRYIQQ